jgi:hypothetical protein
MIKSSAVHVRKTQPVSNSNGAALRTDSISKDEAPRAMSTSTPLFARSRTTRFRSAKCRASSKRGVNCCSRMSTTFPSKPISARTVNSIPCVSRGSPHHDTARPPMRQPSTPRLSSHLKTSLPAASNGFTIRCPPIICAHAVSQGFSVAPPSRRPNHQIHWAPPIE